MARFASQFTPRTEIGAGLESLMGALFAQKLNGAGGETAAKRTAAQDFRDQEEGLKARAEATEISRRESGIADYVPNFARSLVPGQEVPHVMSRLETGEWPAREDDRLQMSTTPGVPLKDWSPENDAALRDAQQVSAALFASKPADFKDLNAAQQAPATGRRVKALFDRARGGAPAAAVPARADVPQLGLPSGPGMAMPTQVDNGDGVIVRPLAGDIAGLPPLPGQPPVAPMAAQSEQVMPEVGVTAPEMSYWERLLEMSPELAAEDPTLANSVVGAVGERRLMDENARKAAEIKQGKTVGEKGLRFDPNTQQFYIAGSTTPATAAQINEHLNATRSPLVSFGAGAFDRTEGSERAKQALKMQESAINISSFADSARAAAEALEGFGGGWTAEAQAAVGRLLPESDYGKIASVADLARALRAKMAPQLRATGSGATSDLEFGEFMSAFPSLSQTPDGRKFIAETFSKIAEREIVASDIYQELALAGPVKLAEWRKRVRAELGDLIPSDQRQMLRSGRVPSAAAAPARPQAGGDAARLKQLEEDARKRGLTIPP